MKKLLLNVVLVSLCGCLAPAPDAPKKWLIGEIKGECSKIAGVKRDSVKLVRADVRAPYDSTALAVLRADGSVAFDPANAFAASPARLVAGAALDVLESSGFALTVLDPKTNIPSNLHLELVVTRLALDCRDAGRRDALVEVMLRLAESRRSVAVSKAEASVPVDGSDYTKSFSAAFSRAVGEALKRL